MPTNAGSRSCAAETLTLMEMRPSRGLPQGQSVLGDAWPSTSVAEGDDQAGLLGDPDEHVGGDVGAVRLPADQRLDTDDPAGRGAVTTGW